MYSPNNIIENHSILMRYLESIWIICRFETIMIYNLTYFLIILTTILYSGYKLSEIDNIHYFYFLVFIANVLAAKAQASIADTLCDYKYDINNPEKQYVTKALENLGIRNCKILMYSCLSISILLGTFLAIISDKYLILVSTIIFNVLGYYYSFPPRFKERDIWNIVVTSAVDALCIFVIGYYLMIGYTSVSIFLISCLILLYSSSFHLMHMVGDVFEDKKAGVKTLATRLGIKKGLIISALLGFACIPFSLVIPSFIAAIMLYGLNLIRINKLVKSKTESSQSILVSKLWKIKIWAPILNIALVASLLIHIT